MNDELTFQQQFRPAGPANAGEVLAHRQMAPPSRDELDQDAAARAEATALAEQREQLALANAVAGNPLGELSRAQQIAADARDRVRDLETQLASARETVRRADDNVTAWASDVDEVRASVAQRSSTEHDLLAPAKAAHLEFAQATRAAFAAVQAGTPRQASRPFVSRGSVTRSELECWHCVNDNVSHEDSVLLHLDPRFDVPITTMEQALAAEQAERRGHHSGREISR